MSDHAVMLLADTSEADAAILRAACENEEGSREKVRALLARAPEWIGRLGTLVADAERTIIAEGIGQVLAEEAVYAELRELRSSLAEPGDGALERLLVQHAALRWLALMVAETGRTARWRQGTPSETGDFWDRHVSRLNSDFLRASRTLATVRRLRLPAVQVNIAEQQVNVAS